ncbi:MAG TPA: hypothetical protein VF120_13365 [Ktedonobacterales bacterium]
MMASGGSRWAAIRYVRRIQLACGFVASASGLAALVALLTVSRVPTLVWDRSPRSGVVPTMQFVPLIQAVNPPAAWWLLIGCVTLCTLAVGVCAAFGVRTGERRWRWLLTGCGILVAVCLMVLARGSLSLFEDGPVLFVPSLAPILACIGLSFLSDRPSGQGPTGKRLGWSS